MYPLVPALAEPWRMSCTWLLHRGSDGKAIEIQSISRCQEEIKGQIAFLIRAEALR